MIKTVHADRLERFMNSGRTSPVLCHCVDDQDSDAGEFVVKCFGGIEHGRKALGFELLGSMLAGHFGIHTPIPAIVIISAEFVQAAQSIGDSRKSILSKSIGKNFGSTYVHPVSTLPVGKPISSELFPKAVNIFAFDALIQNADRRTENPNLFVSANEIVVVDHEMAFGFWADLIKNTAPWDMSGANYMKNHVFYRHLKEATADFTDFHGKLLALSDETMAGLIDLCPEEWISEVAKRIVEHMQQVRENADKFIESISELLV